ncbi:MAG: transposon-encoded TnpW family protein [Oscillospiraceae bacterium]|nr:transposon-encoded TnpW family protein [Oscillospiraceae bacterium]
MDNKAINSASEYKIGGTTYIVTIKFNSELKEDISDVIKRLILREVTA